MGDARGREVWEPLLDARFARRGAYHVPHGEFDWETHAPGSYVPPRGRRIGARRLASARRALRAAAARRTAT